MDADVISVYLFLIKMKNARKMGAKTRQRALL
jgi:hypothetical protein